MGNPSNSKPPKEESGNFTTTRVLSYGFLFSLGMVGVSSALMPENMQYWGYLSSVLAGYLAGRTTSVVFQPKE